MPMSTCFAPGPFAAPWLFVFLCSLTLVACLSHCCSASSLLLVLTAPLFLTLFHFLFVPASRSILVNDRLSG
ncbi:hypothetical protein B0O80DRAFT_439716 [Mortierella sp. GBAus27b]|nr:hypothetical protein B0O80DRAFT_439716 [Mortierella sp. GBAus27b]